MTVPEAQEKTRLLGFARELALRACHEIRASGRGRVTAKENPADLVTEADLRVERMLRASIGAAFPAHAVVGEELPPTTGTAQLTWYLDPIDGTANFASGLPWSSVSIAVADDSGPLVGVVAAPWQEEIFSAARGGGAFVNGHAIQVQRTPSLAGRLVLTEWAGHRPWSGMADVLLGLQDRYATVRIMGSSALALASVAAGRAAAAFIGASHPVDDMAGLLLCTEAGARAVPRDASDLDENGILVCAPEQAEQLSRLWR
ncbi:MAG TPA: inositol monophosphatase family protein [Gryllotalpicola sp.]